MENVKLARVVEIIFLLVSEKLTYILSPWQKLKEQNFEKAKTCYDLNKFGE
jgi:hypothetical protein